MLGRRTLGWTIAVRTITATRTLTTTGTLATLSASLTTTTTTQCTLGQLELLALHLGKLRLLGCGQDSKNVLLGLLVHLCEDLANLLTITTLEKLTDLPLHFLTGIRLHLLHLFLLLCRDLQFLGDCISQQRPDSLDLQSNFIKPIGLVRKKNLLHLGIDRLALLFSSCTKLLDQLVSSFLVKLPEVRSFTLLGSSIFPDLRQGSLEFLVLGIEHLDLGTNFLDINQRGGIDGLTATETTWPLSATLALATLALLGSTLTLTRLLLSQQVGIGNHHCHGGNGNHQ